ncbi:hypothetical protein J1N35_043937 [Gossypium stocksii]|uniref:Uncharacterized protein n=1 Tax=Gossypium stocksii TaxID=47602 RepID=A0A9D3ZFZ2_9ROSI|nr:hypothetical protein J1N35_043937 [Gossypium stocksii]
METINSRMRVRTVHGPLQRNLDFGVLPSMGIVLRHSHRKRSHTHNFIDSVDLDKLQNIDMENVTKYLTQGRGSWNYRLDTGLQTNFNKAIMFPIAKMWMQFIGTKIAPILNVSNINVFQVVLLYDNLQRK